MDFFLAMSIFSSAPDLSREKGKAQEWIKAWVARSDDKGAAVEQGNPQQQNRTREQVMRPREQRPHGEPRFAPEFDGLNCFETMVSH